MTAAWSYKDQAAVINLVKSILLDTFDVDTIEKGHEFQYALTIPLACGAQFHAYLIGRLFGCAPLGHGITDDVDAVALQSFKHIVNMFTAG